MQGLGLFPFLEAGALRVIPFNSDYCRLPFAREISSFDPTFQKPTPGDHLSHGEASARTQALGLSPQVPCMACGPASCRFYLPLVASKFSFCAKRCALCNSPHPHRHLLPCSGDVPLRLHPLQLVLLLLPIRAGILLGASWGHNTSYLGQLWTSGINCPPSSCV